ncbi:basic proline-rich protein-like isoform X17 [Cygnus olor]|uniref:basic proline-rich protein-like isoform X17 n=1 Tax=Cygnus olor TaxID=8869 RepID=UPI001ADE38EF|nr:basic proline-rich protein-like isoform X17 [Cygnus olor]
MRTSSPPIGCRRAVSNGRAGAMAAEVAAAPPRRVQVCVRLRPGPPGEEPCLLPLDSHTLELREEPPSAPSRYRFDAIYGAASSTATVYEGSVRPLLSHLLAGRDVTVLAYGPSGSGKTHTMLGSEGEPGLVQRALEDVLEAVGDSRRVTVACMEVYCEEMPPLPAMPQSPGPPPPRPPRRTRPCSAGWRTLRTHCRRPLPGLPGGAAAAAEGLSPVGGGGRPPAGGGGPGPCPAGAQREGPGAAAGAGAPPGGAHPCLAPGARPLPHGGGPGGGARLLGGAGGHAAAGQCPRCPGDSPIVVPWTPINSRERRPRLAACAWGRGQGEGLLEVSPSSGGGPQPPRCPQAKEVTPSHQGDPEPPRCPKAEEVTPELSRRWPQAKEVTSKPPRWPQATKVTPSQGGDPEPSRSPQVKQVTLSHQNPKPRR